MSPFHRFEDDSVSPAQIRAAGMAECLDGSLYCVVCGFSVPCANPPLHGEALVRAASHVCPRPESEVSEAHKLHYDCWAALDEIMVEAGMNPKLQPAEAQAWLRERLRHTQQPAQAPALQEEVVREHRLDGLPIGHLISLLADVREDREVKDEDRAALEKWRAEYQARVLAQSAQAPTGRALQPPRTQARPTPAISVAPERALLPVDYAALEARVLAQSESTSPSEPTTTWTFRAGAFRCDACGLQVKFETDSNALVTMAQHVCPPSATALSRLRTAVALTTLYRGRALVRQAAFDGALTRSDGPQPLALDAVPHGLTCNSCQSLGPFVTERRTSARGATDYYVRCSGCGSWDVRERSAALGPVTLGEHSAVDAYQKATRAVTSTPLQVDATGRIDALATLLAAANAVHALCKREFVYLGTPPPETADQRQAALVKRDGFMCEAHPGLPFDHDPNCPGPGTPWMIEGRAAIEQLVRGLSEPDWTCSACASRGPFRTVKHETHGEPTDYDMECLACGSLEVHESAHEAFQAHVEKRTAHEDAPPTPEPGVEP